MVIYYSREYHSATIGVRLEQVKCEKCSTEYYYELARMGSGKASAPFAIGTNSAAERSTDQAQLNLDRRLAEEAEIVPCPKCFWINEELIQGYRRGSYRRWSQVALGLGFFGSVASLLMGWFLSNGPAADRDALPYLLYGGPTVSIGLGVIIYLLRVWLRSRIQPNQKFPDPPKLPSGSPVALIRNPETGEFRKAPPLPNQEISNDGWVVFQIGRIRLTNVCCVCLGVPDPHYAYRRPLAQAVELVVPRCGSCLQERKRKSRKYALITVVLVICVSVPILLWLKLEGVSFWAWLIGLSIVIPYLFGTTLADSQTEPVRINFVDNSRGIFRLKFRNQDYRKLIESDLSQG